MTSNVPAHKNKFQNIFKANFATDPDHDAWLATVLSEEERYLHELSSDEETESEVRPGNQIPTRPMLWEPPRKRFADGWLEPSRDSLETLYARVEPQLECKAADHQEPVGKYSGLRVCQQHKPPTEPEKTQ